MTVVSTLSAIGKVAVGGSAEYPVLSVNETQRREATASQSGEAMRRVEWRLSCLALTAAGDPTGIATLNETLQGELARRGLAVVLTERGTPRTLPAEGGSAGSAIGYPQVDVSMSPGEMTFGPWQQFELRVVTLIPQPADTVNGYNLVEHAFERTDEADENSKASATQRGTVRVRGDQDASAYIQSQILDAARTAAEANDQGFRSRISTIGGDASLARYEYSELKPDPNPYSGSGVEEPNISDTTTTENEGRIRQVIRGSAKGSGAAAFAIANQPTLGSLDILTRDEVSEPSTPDGRVDFNYEVQTGTLDATNFPGKAIFSVQDVLEEIPGGRATITIDNFMDGDPIRYLGPNRAWRYRQRTRVEFTGPWTEDIVTPAWDASGLVEEPRIVRESSGPGGTRRVDVVMEFSFDEQQSLVIPFELGS